MDDMQFFDDTAAQPLPRRPVSDARITDCRVMPWPDGTRVTVEMGLTPFREFPSIDVSILTLEGEVLRYVSLVGAMERRPAPTMWLPRGIPRGTLLIAMMEVLGEESPVQVVRAEFAVAGPIVRMSVTPPSGEGA